MAVWLNLADHPLAPQLMSQILDGNQGLLVGVILPMVDCHGSNWHLLFFDTQ